MEKYTPKQRLLSAMNLQKPDQVPLMCQFSIGSMMVNLHPNPAEFWYDVNTFAHGLVSLCEKYKFDGILVSLHGHSDRWKKDLISSEQLSEGKVLLTYPDRTELHSWEDLPMIKFNKEIQRKASQDVDLEKDVPQQINYIPVSHNLYFDLHPDHMYDIFDILYDKVGDKYSIHGEITSPFDYLLDMLGYEDALLSLILDPDKCKDILQKFTDGIIKLSEDMCEKHIDAIKISSPFAGMGFISTEHYLEFVLPYEQQIISAIRAKGKHVYIHTCGSIGDRLEIMRESGASGLECLDPEPVGNVDLEDAFSRIGNDMFIKGNIDSVNSLLLAEDQKAEQDVLKIIKTGKEKGKGFILSTACSIAPKVKPERLIMLSDLIEKHGKY